jgi:hypothetical protein
VPKIWRFVKVQRDVELNVCAPAGEMLGALLPASDPNSFFTRFAIADAVFVERVLQSELDGLEEQIASYMADGEQQRLEIARQIEEAIVADKVMQDDTKWNLKDPAMPAELSFFYQDEAGQLVFLDRLNIEMLIDEFGSIEAAPDAIEGPVVNTFYKVVDRAKRAGSVEFAHLPTGAEVRFAVLDLSAVCSPDVVAAYAFRIRLKRPARKKKATGKVITKEDFQTFVALPPEREVNLRDEAEFPALSPGMAAARPAAPSIVLKEAYPSLPGAPVRPKTATFEYRIRPAASGPPRTKSEEWPALGPPKVAVERKKSTGSWANVKF